MATVTINGNTYTDDADPDTGLGGGGHRDRFIPLIADVVTVAGLIAEQGGLTAHRAVITDSEGLLSALSAGNSGEVLTSQGAGSPPQWAVGSGAAGRITALASGSLPVGDPVAINADGTVSAIALTTVLGSQTAFESANSNDISCCFDSANNKVVIAFRDAGNSHYGTAIVGTVSGTSISFGTAVVFESAATYETSCCFDSANNKVVITYKDAGNSNYGTAIVGTVSGTSISFGTAVVFESATTSDNSCCFDSANNKIVIAYKDGGNSNYGTAIVGTVSGTSISFGTAVVFESANSGYCSCCFDSANNKVVVTYTDYGNSSYGTAIVGTVSGTSISFGTAVVFESASSYYPSCCFDSAHNKVVVTYVDVGNSSYGTAIVGTVSGTSISFGTAVVFESGGSLLEAPNACFDSVRNAVVITWRRNAASSAKVASALVSGTSLTLETPLVFENGVVASVDCCFDSSQQKTVIAYQGISATYYGTASVYSATSNFSGFIGFPEGTYSDGQSATIQVAGSTDTHQSGLSVAARYYVNDDGTLDTNTAHPYAGIALSSTQLLIKG